MNIHPTLFVTPITSAFLEISGNDAASFLQGQVSCDINLVTTQQAQLGAHCNPKGRVIFSFLALKIKDNYYLQLPNNMIETALKALLKYAVFSKVSLRNATDKLAAIGLIGPSGQQFLPTSVAHLMPELSFFKIPATENQYLIVGPSIKTTELYSALAKHSNLSDSRPEVWKEAFLRNGLANIYPETKEQYTPHQLNYQLTGAVNFKKGCFTGQEIIARMHYLGKLKQALYQFRAETSEAPTLNLAIYSQEKEQAVGNIIDYCQDRDGKILVLAVVHNEYINDPLLHYKMNGLETRLINLP